MHLGRWSSSASLAPLVAGRDLPSDNSDTTALLAYNTLSAAHVEEPKPQSSCKSFVCAK